MERNLVFIALFAALIAALGLIPKIDLASGVPITAQSLGIMLAGTVLGAKRGALAVLLFLALVALGLPLLAGGRGGLGLFASPTAGFLIGFPVAAFVAGLIMKQWQHENIALVATIAAVIGGIIVLYIFGIIGLSITLDKSLMESTLLMTPFLIGDAIKAVITGLVTQAIAKARPAFLFSRA
ncbi:MAG: biotin transporter BioY [Cohaesibacter sp.]|nr:biotin transporter BioY [Cohaesibacter sp.]MCV6601670.1 biotin transporter BioY [Cohaesibacter sp.]